MRWEPAYDHRHGLHILQTEEHYRDLWQEIIGSIEGVSDEDIIERFTARDAGKRKSISAAVNGLLKDRLTSQGWREESPIFSDPRYPEKAWRLDFAKRDVSIEVGFNHGEAAAWNLMKPVLASELNHVAKAIQTSVGVVIAATDELKTRGGFDSAVGTVDKYIRSLQAMRTYMTVPLVIIGLGAPETFEIVQFEAGPSKKLGEIRRR